MTLKLLLSGQDKSNFQPVKDAFEDDDTDVIVATSIGLALFLARKNHPNLIISQYELTDSDALTFFYELKSEEELAKIPFILLSNSVTNKIPMQDILKNNIPVLIIDKDSLASTSTLRNKILTFITKPSG